MTARRVLSEMVSGSSAIEQRPVFMRLLDKLERDDVLIVTKSDRFGRNAIDVGATVAKLADIGVRVHCLALGGIDLTSPAGRMTMGVINAVAQFELGLLIERTQSGLARARAEGATLGRPGCLMILSGTRSGRGSQPVLACRRWRGRWAQAGRL
jgi:putative DNA-invertase from lambdoid prophage Rac